MKGAKAHRVALAPATVAMLRRMKELAGKADGYVFPGQRPGKPLSQMSMAMLLRRMQGDDEAEGENSRRDGSTSRPARSPSMASGRASAIGRATCRAFHVRSSRRLWPMF